MENTIHPFYGGPFSQWATCSFEIDGVIYNCAEQYMMAQKARIFLDQDSFNRIMATNSPKEQKAIGRRVTNFDAHKWNLLSKDIVYTGNYEKFKQNENLKKKLISTEGTTLVEASPYDKIWGVGLSEDEPRAQKRETWLGTNWLGETLTKVREKIQEETSA